MAAGGTDDMVMRAKSTRYPSFLTVDLAEDVSLYRPGSWNKYAYARSSPMALVDLLGLASDPVACPVPLKEDGTCPTGSGGDCVTPFCEEVEVDSSFWDEWLERLLPLATGAELIGFLGWRRAWDRSTSFEQHPAQSQSKKVP